MKDFIEIDLVKARPEYFSREARVLLGGGEDEEFYTTDIKSTLKAVKVDTAGEGSVHPSFDSKPVKVKVLYEDVEGGYGTYSPGGGSVREEIFAGVDSFDEADLIHLVDDLLDEGYFEY